MIGYFDCERGIAGDMIIAAMLDAGVKEGEFLRELKKLNLSGYDIKIYQAKRCNIRAKRFDVIVTDKQEHHRNLSDITEIIKSSSLSDCTKARSLEIFNKLGQAEAKVHGCDISDIHFHEIGAIDSIIDIVGACICIEQLEIDRIFYSKIATGKGTIKCAHGLLPVPAPATAELLTGKRIFTGQGEGELSTPTGVAIITSLGEQLRAMPEMELIDVGYGAGAREYQEQPNVLRVFVGKEQAEDLSDTDEISVISFNVDDCTAEHSGFLVDKLFENGALDVIQIPAYMKKSRSGTKFEILSRLSDEPNIIQTILTTGTSFGIRISHQKRYKLKRKIIEIRSNGQTVSVKLGLLGEKLVQIAPEYEDCRKLSELTGENFRQVYARILELARKTYYND